ncbi:methyl-accepting chemotaxis protein [Stigmatella aurantiaca]|uniref:Methyl-accepting chemotaxis protein n=1 Tax=Stigmatella aurantiaca (strain DW4/3-1) TaxID=378806 RepID=Q091M3_STIAD|nr:methyl-accepting chemotaxis protein [Stigmatella aurantiaca]ADO68676.1 Methyl-accepting chemotaxis protein [Stigmatella aurantiaca DW4/3-1]EAU66440.1 methyl-accepting chemotaxis sensory transducer [Stigmatella aurantiaca DW4/3-1]
MSIGRKIGTGFGLALLVLLIISGMSLYGTDVLTDTTEELVRSELTIEELRQLTAHLVDAEAFQRNYIITGNEEFLNRYRAAATESRETLQRLTKAASSSELRTRQAANLPALIEARLAFLEETAELRRTKDRDVAIANVEKGTGNTQMAQIRRITSEMLEQERELWSRSHEDASTTSRLILLVVSLGTVVGVLLVLGVSVALTRGITGPLDRLMSGVESFTRGHLAHRIEVHNEDETGKLARAFNAMAERRQESEAQLGRQSEQREQTLRTVAEFVNQLAGASTEILSSTSEQVASAQEQGSAVAETVSTVEEIAQTSDEAAGRARAVSESARQSEELGKGGRRAVDEAVSAMAAVREQVESIATRILALAEQAQAIGDIINTVNDISEQTHMLALNASIEASRAGEHGRGFAVVATEVKALADQSKKATAQVRQILGHIQKATHSAVMTTEEGTKSVAAATRVVGQAGASIQTLGEILAQASLTAAQIAASANQQATGIGQIRQAMRDVNQSAQQALASTRQTERAVQDLNTMGLKLKGLLSEFGR